MSREYKTGSLFAGIGGICIAFMDAGCKISWANELDSKACETYRYNFEHTIIEKDINAISNPSDLGEIDIITSGFPCQAFSVAGYRQGFNDKKGRGNLFFETARFIEALKPKAFLLENVKNLVGHDKGKTFAVIQNTITKELNYSFIPFVMNSKDYGDIPQTRERIYIVGFRGEGEYELGLNTDPSESLFLQSSSKATCTRFFNIPKKIPLKATIHDVLSADRQDQKYYYQPDHRYYPKLSEHMTKRDTVYQWRRVYVRENKNNVCPTLTANMGTGGHNVPLILDSFGIRKLTPKECLGFQGFPDSFRFPEKMANSHCYKQAGNSVVVPVVRRIAEAMVKALDVKYSPVKTNEKTGS